MADVIAGTLENTAFLAKPQLVSRKASIFEIRGPYQQFFLK